jgi:Protein of unknown function (DUF2442)
MTTSVKIDNIFATDVWFTETKLYVRLSDDREIAVPLSWFPSLQKATESERKNWRFIGKGLGIHWEQLDEDISVKGLLKI